MKTKILKGGIASLAAAVFAALATISPAFAADVSHYVQVSPVNQNITIEPGTSFNGSFKVNNIGNDDFEYSIDVSPFSVVGDNYDPDYTTRNGYNQLADWITLDKTSGKLSPGNSDDITYTITVPANAPYGGQYATINTSVNNQESDQVVQTTSRLAMLIYAKIPGETIEKGEIQENNVPGIVFGGNKITATSLVSNEGNIHAIAKYIMKVYPFGSDEEIYTNEEDPLGQMIIPETRRYYSQSWEETPQLGLYTVEQTIEFMGQTSTTSKLVLVCPVWLIVIFIALILAIIFTVATRARSRKQERRASAAESARDLKDAKKD